MLRIASRLGLLALPLALGGCIAAAPVGDYYYVPPPVIVGDYPYVERHYVLAEDRVVISSPRNYYFTGPRYVREYRGPGRHRIWYTSEYGGY